MQDPTLDRQVTEIRELQQMWQLFHEFFKLALGGQSPSAENEAKFLGVKSKIAMFHETFMEALKQERQTGQNMMAIVARCITLRHVQRLTDVDIKKMNIEWHEAYLLLQNTLGELEEKREDLAQVNPTAYHLKRIGGRGITSTTNFLKGGAFRIFVITVAVVGAIWGFLAFGGMKAMKSSGISAPIAYFLEDNYRIWFSPELPLDNVSRMWKAVNALPNDFTKEGQGNTVDKDAVIAFMRFPAPGATKAFDAASDLSDATEFERETIRYAPSSGPGAGTMEVYSFRFPYTQTAKEFIIDYQDWRRDQPEQVKRNADDRLRIVRVVNVVVIMRQGSNIMRDRMIDETFKRAQKAVL